MGLSGWTDYGLSSPQPLVVGLTVHVVNQGVRPVLVKKVEFRFNKTWLFDSPVVLAADKLLTDREASESSPLPVRLEDAEEAAYHYLAKQPITDATVVDVELGDGSSVTEEIGDMGPFWTMANYFLLLDFVAAGLGFKPEHELSLETLERVNSLVSDEQLISLMTVAAKTCLSEDSLHELSQTVAKRDPDLAKRLVAEDVSGFPWKETGGSVSVQLSDAQARAFTSAFRLRGRPLDDMTEDETSQA